MRTYTIKFETNTNPVYSNWTITGTLFFEDIKVWEASGKSVCILMPLLSRAILDAEGENVEALSR